MAASAGFFMVKIKEVRYSDEESKLLTLSEDEARACGFPRVVTVYIDASGRAFKERQEQ